MGRVFERVRERVQALSPRTVLIIGFAGLLLYAFPGYMSSDSVQQLGEARTGHFTDGHPPLMSAMWRYLDMIVSGPLLMLCVQGTVFLWGLYVLFQRVMSPKAAAWCAIGLLLFPPVMTPMGVIWKDSQMAAYLVAGTAALVQPKRRLKVLGLVLLVIACALRHNALAAVVPVVAILFEWRAGIPLWKRLAIIGGGTVVVLALAFGMSKVLTTDHVKLTPVWQDIVGVIAYTETRTDADLENVLRGTPLIIHKNIQEHCRKLAKLRGAWRITEGDDRLFGGVDPNAWPALNRAWRDLVFGDPVAYLAYHWAEFKVLLGIPHDSIAGTVWNLFLERNEQMDWVEHNANWSLFQAHYGPALYKVAYWTPLFKPYFYLVIGLALLLLFSRDRLTFALISSGILYEASFFPVAANPDYRYSHWMITTVCIASILIYVQRRRAKQAAA